MNIVMSGKKTITDKKGRKRAVTSYIVKIT